MRRRLPPLLLLEFLLGGLLAAAALGLLFLSVQSGRQERSARDRERQASRALLTYLAPAEAGLLPAAGGAAVGRLELRWAEGPASARDTPAGCVAVRLEVVDPADPRFRRATSVVRCALAAGEAAR